jgi:hypothetical protein
VQLSHWVRQAFYANQSHTVIYKAADIGSTTNVCEIKFWKSQNAFLEPKLHPMASLHWSNLMAECFGSKLDFSAIDY